MFDVLVVGGGITGAWAAYDAALRGLSVALVEKGDWASGTSSASSKLVHGGLRYLERYDFGLVRHALAERKRLHDFGGHQVRPLRFLVPLFKGGRVGPLKMKAGLVLYDLLAGSGQPVARHRVFSPEGLYRVFPYVDKERLRTSFSYGDCQTDDARMTFEVVDGAREAGAVTCSYARVERLLVEGGRAVGASVVDVLSGEVVEVRSRSVIMAASIWSGGIEGMPEVSRGWVRMSKGIHLVLPRLDTEHALLLTARSDGRVFFVIPWYERTLVGTTDTDYVGDPDEVCVTEEDVAYLLEAVKGALSGLPWTKEDVIGSYCGLRMLQRKGKGHPSAASREWTFKRVYGNVLMPLGGKFTTGREDAGRLVDALYGVLGEELVGCATASRVFPWGGAPEDSVRRLLYAGVDEEAAKYVLWRHGRHVERILALIEEDGSFAGRVDPELPFIEAELEAAIRFEDVRTAEDVVRRRVPLRLLSREADVWEQKVRERLA